MLSRRPLIFLIVLLSIYGPISTDMYLPALNQMCLDFNTTEAMLNMSLYMFMLAFAFSILLMGPISDKFGRRKILTISMIVYIIPCLTCYYSPNVEVFVALRIVQAIGAGGALTTAFALIKDCFEGKDLSRTLTIVATIGILGPMLAPVLGSLMITAINWGATFWIPGIIATICLILGLFLSPELPKVRSNSVSNAVRAVFIIAKNKTFTMFCVMMTIFTSSMLAFLSVSSYVLGVNGYGFNEIEYSVSLAVLSIVGLIISLAIRNIKPITNRRMLAVLFILGVTGLVLMLTLSRDGWYFFLLAMIPYTTILVTTRSYGFGILMNNHEGDNGAVSALLNFSTFILAFFGMLIASSFPNTNFIEGIATVMLISCSVFFIFWMIIRWKGYPLKGLEE